MAMGHGLQRLAVGTRETPCTIVKPLHAHAALVHCAVVEAAQRHEVREFRGAAVGPVLQVMAVHVALVGATREHAPTVPGRERPPQRRRDRARLATDVQRLAAPVLEDCHETRITGEAPGRLDRDGRAILDFTAVAERDVSVSAETCSTIS